MGKKKHETSKHEWDFLGAPKSWWMQKAWMHEGMGKRFWVFTCPRSQNAFPKIDSFSNSNLGCHTLPIPCNNQLNQFLVVINDWVNKTRKVVDSFDGFSLWHLDFPHWSKGLNIPPFILRKPCPFSLLLHWHSWLWIFLIKMHIYMMSNL